MPAADPAIHKHTCPGRDDCLPVFLGWDWPSPGLRHKASAFLQEQHQWEYSEPYVAGWNSTAGMTGAERFTYFICVNSSSRNYRQILAAKCGQAGLACRRRAFQVLKGLVGCGANEKKNMADRNSDSLAAGFLRQACRPREEEFPKGCGRRMPVRRPPDAAQPIRRIMAPPMTSRMASTRTTESFSPKNNTAMIMPKMTDVSRRAATRAMGATVMAQMAMP